MIRELITIKQKSVFTHKSIKIYLDLMDEMWRDM